MRRRIKDIKLIDLFESTEPAAPASGKTEEDLANDIHNLTVALLHNRPEEYLEENPGASEQIKDLFDLDHDDFDETYETAASALGPEYKAYNEKQEQIGAAKARAYIDAKPAFMPVDHPDSPHKDAYDARIAREEAQLAATRALYESTRETESLSRGSLYRRRYYGRY
tara:strand:- start:87 stop:590 length:504 start_codon:yes stop_codon:yes gene_type:complete